MHMKVPEVRRCCFCFPLRQGIIVFGYINLIISLAVVVCLVITTELKKSKLTGDTSLEVITSTILFSILGMSIILNIVLLVAGYQKDISMLRLYNYYGSLIILASFVPTMVLTSRLMFLDVFAALCAIATQCYVILLVRSEVVKLEHEEIQLEGGTRCDEEAIDISDRETLL
ncbi:uncharacterized protein LOC119192069 [Manduca sexta]|uniref:Uncharacterized protein n=1 Tax=Manduca sexta TaxID=7130 RepID=A0A921YRE6_MANSE|nr:uncharacterized protein LOC119192069 [Manduca sexta]KAG6444023.1 hypothetical protein O3G_MSEX003133 [Manduca sexta]